jgi:hypothetical protein
MSVYFSYFPKGVHTENRVTDITRRVDFRKTTLADPYAFQPYQIVGDDRAEDIALYYYGGVEYTWLVWMSNRVIDPYFEWPMSDTNFNRYIQKKYAAQANTTGQAVIDWTLNTEIDTNIVFYRNIEDPDIKIYKDTYTLDDSIVASEWEALRYYDYELELNNDRRLIQLLDKQYTRQVQREIIELLNDAAS